MSVICLVLVLCLLLQQSHARLPSMPQNLLTTFKPSIKSANRHDIITYIDGRNMKDRTSSMLEIRGGKSASFLSGLVDRSIQTIEDILSPFIPKSLQKYLFFSNKSNKLYGKISLKSKKTSTSTMINTSTDKNSRVQKVTILFIILYIIN